MTQIPERNLSNLGKWTPWYKNLKAGDAPRPYGITESYRLGAEWLANCAMVEDWGCGMGYMRRFIEPSKYIGIDGTISPFADEVQDLTIRRSKTDGLFMRGVIEHDWRWRDILDNAIASFQWRMCLVLFTPMAVDCTKQLKWIDELGVPDISFAMSDLLPYFDGIHMKWVDIKSDTGYGGERVFYLEK